MSVTVVNDRHRGARTTASRTGTVMNIQPAKHSEVVRAALEDLIVSGKLAPGSRLDEETLAVQFGVSRTPVREALLQLATSGLVVTRPRQSATVAKPSVADVMMSFELTLELECICARLSARRMTDGERGTLTRMVDQMRRARKPALEDYVRHNLEFHHLVYAGSHNRIIEAQAKALFARLSPFRRQTLLRPGRAAVAVAQHAEVASAIAAGDEADAEARMRHHASLTDSSVLDVIAMIET